MTGTEAQGEALERPAAIGRSSATAMLVGTVVMGLSGLVVLLATALAFSAADYALFGVFWASVYFLVTVMTGVQQETTRASLADRTDRTVSLPLFAVLLAVALFVVVAGSSVWWSDAALGPDHHLLAVLVAAGAAGYVLNCVLTGMLAGAGQWRGLGTLLIVEGTLRGAGMCVVLAITSSVELAAWVVVLTYPLTLLIVLGVTGRTITGRTHVAGTMRRLWANTAQTMAGAAGVGALVTGFPFFMSVLARDESAVTVGSLTLALMLTRAPLLVPLLGLQTMLVSAFVARRESPWRLLVGLTGLAAVVGGVLSLLAGVVGPVVLQLAFGSDFVVRGRILALLVVSATALAAMTLITPALVARTALAANAVAWLLAAAVSVAVLASAPWSLEWRTAVALIVGPLVGIGVQVWSLCLVRVVSGR